MMYSYSPSELDDLIARQQADEEEVERLRQELAEAERRLHHIEAMRRRELDYRRLRAEAEARRRGEYFSNA